MSSEVAEGPAVIMPILRSKYFVTAAAVFAGLLAACSATPRLLADEAPSGPSSAAKDALAGHRPMGHFHYTVSAELDDAPDLKEGDKVDVKLVAFTEEGSKATTILRNTIVLSVRRPNDLPSDVAEEGEFPVRDVSLSLDHLQLEHLRLAEAQGMLRLSPSKPPAEGGVFGSVLNSFVTNLFQPLLLFFFMGFAVPLLKVPLEFPKALYQSLTLYLLVAIGWHGGELMSQQPLAELKVAGGLVFVGLLVNGFIGILATKILEWFTPMRKLDAVTVGAYYGSDSAGTFVTCLGILAALGILHDSYMPVMLAIMEIPGCLVGLFLVSRLRRMGMDTEGNMPGESGYTAVHADGSSHEAEAFSWKILHEVFLNPGLFLLFGGIIVGFISGLQSLSDPHVVEGPDHLFVFIFKGALCLFLLEMGMTACRRLGDLKTAGLGFVIFGLAAPTLFASIGMAALHGYSLAIGHQFHLGTYALFAVLCGAASYIAVPAVQRLAIPEASPTLPLAASLGLTFTWNVTLGIPIYIEIARAIIKAFPVG